MSLHPFRAWLALLFAAVVIGATPAHAELPPDVLLKSRWIVLTKADYQAALNRIPAAKRFQFAMSVKRIETLLSNMMVERTLAAHARLHGVKPVDFATGAQPLDNDKALAQAELNRVEAEANAAFDRDIAAFEMAARETHKLNPERYRAPDEVRLSEIAVFLRGRSDEAARQRANEARERIKAGGDFATIAREYSDDESTKEKGGALPFVDPSKLHPNIAKAVAALKRVGDVSEPVRVSAAYHVLRLEERKTGAPKSFEEARAEIMDELRKRHIADQRGLVMDSIHNDPSIEVNRPAIESLVNRIDPRIYKVNPADLPAPAAK